MTAEGITEPLRWTLDQIKTRLPSMVAEAGYADIVKMTDRRWMTQSLSQVEKVVFANLIVKIVMSQPPQPSLKMYR